LAQFRTTADLVDSVLRRSGELTDGNSPFESQALDYLNEIHQTIINGGNEFDVNVDENWTWAKSKQPIIIELHPKHDTGTVSLTSGSESGSFSSAPSASMEGRYLLIDNRPEKMKIISHAGGNAAFELDSAYVGTTGSALGYKAVMLDYELKSSYYIVNEDNQIINFEETSGTELTATLTVGSYTASDLASEIKTQLDSAGASTYTVSYNAINEKFTLLSDGGGGGGIFSILGATGTDTYRNAHDLLGLDNKDYTLALTYSGIYIKDGICRLFESLNVHGAEGQYKIAGISELKMSNDYPINNITEGIPEHFAQVKESSDGRLVVRFDKYPKNLTRVEVDYIPIAKDLKDNAASVPLLPRTFMQILEFGACFYLLVDKEDSKAQSYATLAGAKLKAMVKQNRKELSKTGKHFGSVIPRLDRMRRSRKLIYGEPNS